MKNEVFIYKNPQENTPGNISGYKAVIRRTGEYFYYHLAEFDNMDQLYRFCKKFNITLLPKDENDSVIIFETSKKIIDSNRKFWKLSDLPKNAKPIFALSNGSVVKCYYTNTKTTVRIYRPNPNSKAVYKPLSIEKHIAHHKKNGIL